MGCGGGQKRLRARVVGQPARPVAVGQDVVGGRRRSVAAARRREKRRPAQNEIAAVDAGLGGTVLARFEAHGLRLGRAVCVVPKRASCLGRLTVRVLGAVGAVAVGVGQQTQMCRRARPRSA